MHILRSVMLRRLLACLALITGLAAVGAPASATLAEALCCESGVDAGASADVVEDRTGCPEQDRANPADTVSSDDRPIRSAPRLIHMPVLYGVDRAYE